MLVMFYYYYCYYYYTTLGTGHSLLFQDQLSSFINCTILEVHQKKMIQTLQLWTWVVVLYTLPNRFTS